MNENQNNATTVPATSIDLMAMNRAILDTLTGTAKQTMDTMPYKVLDKNFAIVCINPDCKSKYNKKNALAILKAYEAAHMAMHYEYKGVTAYELVGNDDFTPHGMLAAFIDLEARAREQIKADRRTLNERNAVQLESARAALEALKANDRDAIIEAYHNGTMNREDARKAIEALG